MAPSSAVCFLICSAALCWQALKSRSIPGLRVLRVAILLVAIYGLLDFVSECVGMDLNFDKRWISKVGAILGTTLTPMSPITGVAFLLFGLGAFPLLTPPQAAHGGSRRGRWTTTLGLVTILLGATIVLSWLYGTPLMYGDVFVPMAGTTSIAFIFLGIALIAAMGPGSFLMRRLVGESTSARLLRAFLPLVVFPVLVQGILSPFGSTFSVLNQALFLALLVVVLGTVTALLAARVARTIAKGLDDVSELLRQSNERNMAILQTAMDGFWLTDIDGRLLEVNAAYCRMSGYPRHELLRMRISDLEAVETEADTAAHLQKIMSRGEESFESRHRRKDGSIFHVEISVQYGRIAGRPFVCFLRDITERKRAEVELAQQRQQLFHMERIQTMGVLASSLAHEINQPLAGILSNTQAAQLLLESATPDLIEIRSILADIVSDDKRVAEVISRLRPLLRKEEPKRVTIDVNELIRNVLVLVHGEIVIGNASLLEALAEGLPRVRADRVQIEQVLINLLMNALQAMSDGAVRERRIILVTALDETRSVTVTVRDTGPGIAPEHLPALFEPFFTTKTDGLGMGLPISRSIVMAHGGKMGADNHPDGGAILWFSLPVEDVQ